MRNSTKENLFIIEVMVGMIILVILPIHCFCDSIYAWVFVCFYLFSVYSIWIISDSKINPFILFFLTFGLFIGGRFFGKVLGYNAQIFELDFFITYTASPARKIELMILVIGFIWASVVGYICSCLYKPKKVLDFPTTITTNAAIANIVDKSFYFLAIVVVYSCLKNLSKVLSEGYVALYLKEQTEAYSGGNGMWGVLMLIFFGLAYGYGTRGIQKKYLLLYVIQSIFSIIMGQRGGFGTTLLILLWIYSFKHEISLKKMMICCVVGVLLILFAFSFSIRAAAQLGNDSLSDWEMLLSFISGQGITLMIFDASRLIEEYPILPYFNSLIPGVSSIYATLTGETLHSYDVTFPAYMGYCFNTSLFYKGFGLGWSVLSDIYLYANRYSLIFIFLSFVFGFIFSRIELYAISSRFYKSLLFTLAFPLMMLPRSGLNTFCTLLVYFFVVVLGLIFFIQLFKRGKAIN